MSLASNISDALGGKRTGKGYLMKCPIHNSKNGDNLMVSDTTDKKSGKPDISVHCFAGCDWKSIKDYFRSMGLLPDFIPARQGSSSPSSKHPEKIKTNFIWKQSKRDKKTVSSVLKHRGITVGHDSLAIRKNSYQGNDMLVFAMTKPGDDKVLAVQRMPFDSKTFKKTGKGLMYGKSGNGDENYCHSRGVYFYRKQPVENFIVGEGIETTLAAMQAMGMNGCACLSTAGMQNITLPEGINNLYICVDSDKNFAGQKASIKLADRYKNKIKNIFMVSPCESCFSDTPDKVDFNDLLMGEGGEESIRDRFGAAVDFKDFSWVPPKNDVDAEFIPETLAALKKLNEKYAAVLMSGNFRVLREGFDETEKKHSLSFLKKTAFADYMCIKKVLVEKNDELKPAPIGKTWLSWSGRRTYSDVVFDPTDKNDASVYNLFKGLLKPKKGNWSRMQYHMKNVICNGNEKHYEYLIAWMARIVQKPGGLRPGVAVVMRGKKGCGKGAFTDYFKEIFGESFLAMADPKHFTGQFNMHLSKALVVLLDEAVWGGDKQSESKLKFIITAPETLYTPKGIDSIPMKSFLNIIIASNEDWVVPATGDERRFFVLDVSKKFLKNKKYFDAFYDEILNGGPAAMMYDLLKHDYSAINLRDAPFTDSLVEQIQQSLPITLDFWMALLSRGFLLSDKFNNSPMLTSYDEMPSIWPNAAWKFEVFNEFQEWCSKKKERYIPNERIFWRKTWEIWPGGKPGRMQRKQDGQKWDAIIIPSLKALQEKFSRVTRIKFDTRENEIDTSFDFGANIGDDLL
jgi:hypothetical protein